MQKEFDSILRSLLGPSGEDGHDGTAGVLLAVSGGIDSMCLADLVLHSSLSLRFAVAHCNFHLRGEESDSDQALVEQWCRKNGARLFLADFDTAPYASEKGLSIEMAARELRYRWFGSLCIEHGFSGTVVAHNSNDNVETLILNLLRGTGLGLQEWDMFLLSLARIPVHPGTSCLGNVFCTDRCLILPESR